MTKFRPVEDQDVETLVALWDACDLTRPWNPATDDIARLRAHPMAEILVAVDRGAVVASIAVGYDGHRAWAYYVATDPAHRSKGLGRQAVLAAEAWARARGIVKLMLMVRDTNADVAGSYGALGYDDAGVRVLQKWLSPERASLYAAGHHG